VEVQLGKVTPASVLAADIDALRACGLSRPKIAHIRSIAEAVQSGTLNLRRVAKASDEDAQAELVAVKGIGPWTADVYLMFCLGRWDVFPHADIGLSEAYRMIANQRERHSPKKFLQAPARNGAPIAASPPTCSGPTSTRSAKSSAAGLRSSWPIRSRRYAASRRSLRMRVVSVAMFQGQPPSS
jgi:hypothetical protein